MVTSQFLVYVKKFNKIDFATYVTKVRLPYLAHICLELQS